MGNKNVYFFTSAAILGVMLAACGSDKLSAPSGDAAVNATGNTANQSGQTGAAGTGGSMPASGEGNSQDGVAGATPGSNSSGSAGAAASPETGADGGTSVPDGSANAPGCPVQAPNANDPCSLDGSILCIYGNIACACQLGLWSCYETGPVSDAGAREEPSQDGGDGPPWATDGGTSGREWKGGGKGGGDRDGGMGGERDGGMGGSSGA